jgi:hypothetical protein
MWSTHSRRIDPIRDMPNLPQYPGITTNVRNTRSLHCVLAFISFKRLEAENSWAKSDISAPGA